MLAGVKTLVNVRRKPRELQAYPRAEHGISRRAYTPLGLCCQQRFRAPLSPHASLRPRADVRARAERPRVYTGRRSGRASHSAREARKDSRFGLPAASIRRLGEPHLIQPLVNVARYESVPFIADVDEIHVHGLVVSDKDVTQVEEVAVAVAVE